MARRASESAKRKARAKARAWWLYMVRTKTGALYTGITTDVARRFLEHASGGARAARYLRGNAPAGVVFRKRIGPKALAAKVEWRVKRLVRAKKEAIVAAGRLRVDRVTGDVRVGAARPRSTPVLKDGPRGVARVPAVTGWATSGRWAMGCSSRIGSSR